MEIQDQQERILWSVSTGNVNPLHKASLKAAGYMCMQEGFVAVSYEYPHGTLWLYDTENSAKTARNQARLHGIRCGSNICRFRWDGGDTLIQDF